MGLAGTWRLVRLALRRDRIKLTIWLVLIIGTLAATIPAVEQAYDTPAARAAYEQTISSSLVGRMFGGVLDGDSLGAIVMVEAFAFTATLIAFMNTLLVIRHTRQNEEAGASELLQSARVGRYASLMAAMIVAVLANIIVVIGAGLIVSSGGYEPSQSWLLAVTFGLVGLSFAALAAVTAQLSSSARGASALAGAAIGVAYGLRGLGDGFATTVNGRPESAWPSWLSPLGWGQQVYPMTRQNLEVLLLFVVFIVVSVALAVILLQWRDVGVGMLPARKGPRRASAALGSALGLAWRLQRATLGWWCVVMVLLGAIYGSMADQFEALLESSDVIQQYLAAMGGDADIVSTFLGAMLGLTAIAVVAYAVQSLQKLRSEEASGHAESLLATSTGRVKWLLAHGSITAIGAVTQMLLVGAVTGAVAVWAAGQSWRQFDDLLVASLSYMPAIAVCFGIVVASFGLVPRAMVAIGWAMFVFVMVISQLGALLKLPGWLMNSSPFQHIPAVPVESLEPLPLLVLSIIGIVLCVMGLVAFRWRDITA